MTSRILPPDEWPRLDATALSSFWPLLTPGADDVLVVEDASGAIVGSWTFRVLPHVEGVWVDEAHQGKAAVARHLMQAMARHATDRGAQIVITGAASERTTQLLEKLHADPMPPQFLLTIGEIA